MVDGRQEGSKNLIRFSSEYVLGAPTWSWTLGAVSATCPAIPRSVAPGPTLKSEHPPRQPSALFRPVRAAAWGDALTGVVRAGGNFVLGIPNATPAAGRAGEGRFLMGWPRLRDWDPRTFHGDVGGSISKTGWWFRGAGIKVRLVFLQVASYFGHSVAVTDVNGDG